AVLRYAVLGGVVLPLDVAVLPRSLEKALDHELPARARAGGQKTDPGHLRGLLAGPLAARQNGETNQGHAALQELPTAAAMHADTSDSLRGSPVSSAARLV